MLSKSTRPQDAALRTTLRISAALSVLLVTAGCSDSPEQAVPSKVTKPPVESTPSSPSPGPKSAPATAGPATEGAPTKGGLVKDFPKSLIPLMDDAEVLVSDLEVTDGTVSISLVASSKAQPKQILRFYDEALKNHNFESLESNSVEGAASRTYTRGEGTETVNISVVESGPTSTVTIGAHLAADSVDNS
ncbi:MAG TPA: hypothetical protein VFI97_06780 [Arthrobacter sp.]|nr:hypothetical protein [Arthrobacter sp.]